MKKFVEDKIEQLRKEDLGMISKKSSNQDSTYFKLKETVRDLQDSMRENQLSEVEERMKS